MTAAHPSLATAHPRARFARGSLRAQLHHPPGHKHDPLNKTQLRAEIIPASANEQLYAWTRDRHTDDDHIDLLLPARPIGGRSQSSSYKLVIASGAAARYRRSASATGAKDLNPHKRFDTPPRVRAWAVSVPRPTPYPSIHAGRHPKPFTIEVIQPRFVVSRK